MVAAVVDLPQGENFAAAGIKFGEMLPEKSHGLLMAVTPGQPFGVIGFERLDHLVCQFAFAGVMTVKSGAVHQRGGDNILHIDVFITFLFQQINKCILDGAPGFDDAQIGVVHFCLPDAEYGCTILLFTV